MWEDLFDDFSERFPGWLFGYWILNKLLLLLLFCDKTMCQEVALAIFSAVMLLLANTAKSNNSTKENASYANSRTTPFEDNPDSLATMGAMRNLSNITLEVSLDQSALFHREDEIIRMMNEYKSTWSPSPIEVEPAPQQPGGAPESIESNDLVDGLLSPQQPTFHPDHCDEDTEEHIADGCCPICISNRANTEQIRDDQGHNFYISRLSNGIQFIPEARCLTSSDCTECVPIYQQRLIAVSRRATSRPLSLHLFSIASHCSCRPWDIDGSFTASGSIVVMVAACLVVLIIIAVLLTTLLLRKNGIPHVQCYRVVSGDSKNVQQDVEMNDTATANNHLASSNFQ